MLSSAYNLLKTRTAIHTYTLFLGSLASKGIAFAVIFLLAHLLSPEAYETFAIAMTVMWLVFEFTELGMNNTVVRHAAQQVAAGEPARAAGIFRLAATVKIALWIVLFAGIWLASGEILETFMEGRGDRLLLMLAVVAGMGLGGIILLNGMFYSHKQFFKDPLLSITQNLLKLAGILALVAAGRLLPGWILSVYALAAWAAVVLGLILLPRDSRRWGRLHPEDISRTLRFGGFFAGIMILTSFENRLGIFLLKYLHASGGEVSNFFLAQQINTAFILLLGAYTNVMFAKVSGTGAWKEVVRLQKKSLLPLGIVVVGIAVAIAGAGLLVTLLLPARYAGAVPAVRWLFLSSILAAAGTPAIMAILYVRKLAVILASHVTVVVIMTGLSFLWIPRWGACGLAAAFTTAFAVYHAINAVYLLRLLRNKSPSRNQA